MAERFPAVGAEQKQASWAWEKALKDDPADRIVIRNIVRDESVTIRFNGDGKRKRSKEIEPPPRQWWGRRQMTDEEIAEHARGCGQSEISLLEGSRFMSNCCPA
jgi:hypothetical protein